MVLKAFDPVNMSWKIALDSFPFNSVAGCKALVINNLIYLVPSFPIFGGSGTSYRDELYTLDLDNLKFSKKADWPYNSVVNGILFEYKGRLNTYGGEAYRSNLIIDWVLSMDSFEYDAVSDKWIPYYDYSHFFIGGGSYAPRNGSFAYNINNRIFIGIGDDNLMNSNYSNIYEYYLE